MKINQLIREALLQEDRKEVGFLCVIAPDEVNKAILGCKMEDGHGDREFTPHITVVYGFDPSVSASDIQSALKGIGPFKVKLGTISEFNNDDGRVLKWEIESDGLREINRKLIDALPNKQSYPEYKPHLTISYLNKSAPPLSHFQKAFKDVKAEWEVRFLLYRVGDGAYDCVTLVSSYAHEQLD